MSDHIPVEIQLEIMKRLPVKSLIQFQSVSKTWKSHIVSAAFIMKHYNGHHKQVQHQLIQYEDTVLICNCKVDYEQKYVSIVDDHTFPQRKVSPTLPLLVQKLDSPRLIGSSHGLVGLYSYSFPNMFVLWNISIRKAVSVLLPNVRGGIYEIALGFGVCRETNDLKVVMIKYVDPLKIMRRESVSCNTPEVEVFTLSTRAWRRSYGNFPLKSIDSFLHIEVVLDGVFYWLANGKITMDSDLRYMIISFDMTSEEFREVTLPDSLENMKIMKLSKLGESLVVIGQVEDSHYEVWMKGDGVPKSFTKLFTYTLNDYIIELGFQKSGKLIIETEEEGEGDGHRGQLAVYEPYSKHIDNLGINGSLGSFAVCDYTETLLLLDQRLWLMNAI